MLDSKNNHLQEDSLLRSVEEANTKNTVSIKEQETNTKNEKINSIHQEQSVSSSPSKDNTSNKRVIDKATFLRQLAERKAQEEALDREIKDASPHTLASQEALKMQGQESFLKSNSINNNLEETSYTKKDSSINSLADTTLLKTSSNIKNRASEDSFKTTSYNSNSSNNDVGHADLNHTDAIQAEFSYANVANSDDCSSYSGTNLAKVKSSKLTKAKIIRFSPKAKLQQNESKQETLPVNNSITQINIANLSKSKDTLDFNHQLLDKDSSYLKETNKGNYHNSYQEDKAKHSDNSVDETLDRSDETKANTNKKRIISKEEFLAKTKAKQAQQVEKATATNLEQSEQHSQQDTIKQQVLKKLQSYETPLSQAKTLYQSAEQDLLVKDSKQNCNTTDNSTTDTSVNNATKANTIKATAVSAKVDNIQQQTINKVKTEKVNRFSRIKSYGLSLKKGGFKRSLQFRLIVILSIASLFLTALLSYFSYNKLEKTTQSFVDEELLQISLVAINYNLAIPRRWEAPRHGHERSFRFMNYNGNLVIEFYSDQQNIRHKSEQKSNDICQIGRSPQECTIHGNVSDDPQHFSKREIIRNNEKNNHVLNSLSEIDKFEYEIIVAPLFTRPGDALYVPPGINDGFYTLIIADKRVRALISTNLSGQRFVVARPLSSISEFISNSMVTSFWQFILVNLISIPLIIISVRLMFIALNRIAKNLYKRSEDDLSPVLTEDHRGFVPSELDGFIIAINRLFYRVDEGMQSKRRFIADAAHEMRTPLTALSLQAEALEREDLSERARQKVQRLKEGISRERELMTSLLTLAREQNQIDLMLETIDIFQLYVKLIDEQGVIAERKNIDFGIEGNVNFTLISDRARLNRIMANLVSNAIKYTPDGGRVDLCAESFADGSLKLSVKDNGPGIPEDQLKHILEPFYRVDGDRSQIQGTGLGLAIVKASCDTIKAEINFANIKPHGLEASIIVRNLELKQGAHIASK